jgi:hypothetical protein
VIRELAAALGVSPDELEFGPEGIKRNPTFRAMQRRIVQLEEELRYTQRGTPFSIEVEGASDFAVMLRAPGYHIMRLGRGAGPFETREEAEDAARRVASNVARALEEYGLRDGLLIEGAADFAVTVRFDGFRIWRLSLCAGPFETREEAEDAARSKAAEDTTRRVVNNLARAEEGEKPEERCTGGSVR